MRTSFWIAALLGLGSWGCGSDEVLEPARPDAAPPEAPGPFAVGVTTLSATNAERALPVEVWYPAKPGGEVEQYQLMVGVLVLAKMDSPLGAARDAEPDRRGGLRPVVVFSHGNGGTRLQSLYLTEWLATHGFVVAAPDHVGNTIAEMINKDKALPAAQMAALRPQDVSSALDALIAANQAPDGVLSGTVNEERIGVAGHSFGAFTALRVAGATIDTQAVLEECKTGGLICDGWENVEMPESARDPRFVVALAQAPGGAQAMYAGGRNGFADVAVPTMIQGGTSDELTVYAEEHVKPYQSLPEPAWLLGVDRGGHFTFSDMCRIVEIIGLSVEEFKDGCGPDNLPWKEAHAVIQRISTAFFQVELGGTRDYADQIDPQKPWPAGVAAFEAKGSW